MTESQPSPERCSADEYARIFRAVLPDVTETHRRLLAAHYASPAHTTSARALSAAMGWKGTSANVHYGGFAKLLLPFMSKPDGADNLYLISAFIHPADNGTDEWDWVLRPHVIAAATEVGLL